MGSNGELREYCEDARKILEASRRKLSARLLPSADPRSAPLRGANSYFRRRFLAATGKFYLAELEMFDIIKAILGEYDSQEAVVRDCEAVLRVDHYLWADAKTILPTFLVPGASLPVLVLHAVMRDLTKGHLRLVEVIKKGTETIRERLGEQVRDIEEALGTLKWLFRVFAIYPRARAEYLQELRAAGEEILKEEGIEIFYDEKLSAGEVWNPALQEILEDSDVVIALLSEEFFASNYIQTTELRIVGERYQNLRCALFAFLFADCKWKEHPLIKRIELEPIGQSILSLHPTPEERQSYLREKLIKSIIVKAVQKLSNQDSARQFIESLERQLRKDLENPEGRGAA